MSQKVAIVTGANAGIGFAITQELASLGYKTVMACRNRQKAESARQQLLERVPDAELIILPLDLSEPASVQHFAQQFSSDIGELDLLINNAGILAMPLSRNSAGHESQLATNYLSNFALIGYLLPCFREGGQPRIVNVGSLAHRTGKLALDDLNWEATPYTEMKGYAYSKVALLTYTVELNRRLEQSGKKLIALGAHPGFANTEIKNKSPSMKAKTRFSRWFEKVTTPFIPLAADAARPILLAALSEDAKGGDYYGPGGFMEIAGKPAKAKLNPATLVPENGQKLWALSEAMTGVRYLS